MSDEHFNPYKSLIFARDPDHAKSEDDETPAPAPAPEVTATQGQTAEQSSELEGRVDAPRVLFLRDAFFGLGISWGRTVCFRMELQLRLPFLLVSIGLGRPAIVRLGKAPNATR